MPADNLLPLAECPGTTNHQQTLNAPRIDRTILFSVAGLMAAVAAQSLVGDRRQQFVAAFVLHLVATACFLALVRSALMGRFRPRPATIVALALVLRIIALPWPVAFSDDVYRYLHEGNLVVHGHNPFIEAPAEAAEHLRHPQYWSRINHPQLPAVYPPAMQYAMALGVIISGDPLGQKIVFGLFDLLIVVVLLRLWGPTAAMIQALCPLMVLEYAGEAHGDSLCVLFVLLALWCAKSRSVGAWMLAATCLALATASKLVPVVFLPFLAVASGRPLRVVASFVTVLALLYLPFLGRGMFGSTVTYGSEWAFNGSLAPLVQVPIEALCRWLESSGVKLFNLVYYPHNVAKALLGAFAIAMVVWAVARRWHLEQVVARFLLLFVVCAPVVHPWYLTFLIPFVMALQPRSVGRGPILWLLSFSGTAFFFHSLPDRAEIVELQSKWWLRLLEYLPLYVAIVLLLRRCSTMDAETTAEINESGVVGSRHRIG